MTGGRFGIVLVLWNDITVPISGDPLGPRVRVIMSGQAKLKMEEIIT